MEWNVLNLWTRVSRNVTDVTESVSWTIWHRDSILDITLLASILSGRFVLKTFDFLLVLGFELLTLNSEFSSIGSTRPWSSLTKLPKLTIFWLEINCDFVFLIMSPRCYSNLSTFSQSKRSISWEELTINQSFQATSLVFCTRR